MAIMANKRLAVLVGCNYLNTPHRLHGCINDVHAMRDVLVMHYGFVQSQMQVLTDEPGSSSMPTGANIKKALDWLVDHALPGDVLFFHYSGHGKRIPSLQPTNPFRKDEAIVPCDFNLITESRSSGVSLCSHIPDLSKIRSQNQKLHLKLCALDLLKNLQMMEIDEYDLVDPVDILSSLEKSGFWESESYEMVRAKRGCCRANKTCFNKKDCSWRFYRSL